MSKKKIFLIILLVIIIGVAIFIMVNANGIKKENKATPTLIGGSTEKKSNTNSAMKKAKITELEDGTLYSLTDEEITPDIVIGDKYFDTQLADINLNFKEYENKIIEIEGMYLSNNSYTFVGRYSTSNLCQYCPVGYSYFEYEWKAEEIPGLANEKQWIKVIGKLKQGRDGQYDYYYVEVMTLQIMNERGIETVSN